MTYFDQMVKEYRRKGLPKLVIRDKRIPHQWNTYSGIKRMTTKCITLHNSGIDGVSAWGSHNWIKNYSPDNDDKVSWHGHVDYDGSIWQFAEWDDLLWASGTTPGQYTALGAGEYNSRPYDYDLALEIATIKKHQQTGFEGYINEVQLVSIAVFSVERILQFDLKEPSSGTIRKHGDFAKNKPDCPKFLMDPDNWERFINMSDDIYELFIK